MDLHTNVEGIPGRKEVPQAVSKIGSKGSRGFRPVRERRHGQQLAV